MERMPRKTKKLVQMPWRLTRIAWRPGTGSRRSVSRRRAERLVKAAKFYQYAGWEAG